VSAPGRPKGEYRRAQPLAGPMSRRLLVALALIVGWAFGAPALAHKPSDSYLTLKVAGPRIEGRWDIALRDLDFALGLDANGDGDITWGELRARHGEIASFALARLGLQGDGAECSLKPGAQQVDRHTDGAYIVLSFSAECAATPATLTVGYRLFADIDPTHRGLLQLQAQGLTRAAVLEPQAAAQTFELASAGPLAQFRDYLQEGVWHIWIGVDHILFLLSLLLPAVLAWVASRWQAAASFRIAFWDVFRIVTAFTVAHSITLSLATLGLVSLPSRLVESAIAASVVLAALNNVWPLLHERRWMVAFLFGLIHGFGFASVLADLGLPQGTLALALVAFNLGVELGQLAIVAVFLPVAYLLRHTRLYQRGVLVGGSAAIVVIAALWFVERAFDVKILGF
jgi:HupE / UreJ protein